MIEIPSMRPETRYGIPTADLMLFNRQYVCGYSYLFRQPRWVMELIDPATAMQPAEDFDRLDNFREDLRVPELFRSTLDDYRGSGHDRGHMVSSADRKSRNILNSETFLLTNMSPQTPAFNRQIWRKLETAVRDLQAKEEYVEVYVISGPLFEMGDPIDCIGDNKVVIPDAYFKSVLGERADPNTNRMQLDLWTFKIKNVGQTDPLSSFLVKTTDVERQAGLQLWDRLRGERWAEQKNRVREMWDES